MSTITTIEEGATNLLKTLGTVGSAESPPDGTIRAERSSQKTQRSFSTKLLKEHTISIDRNVRGEDQIRAPKCFSLSPRPPPRRLKPGSSSCGSSPAAGYNFEFMKRRLRKFGLAARSARNYDSPLSSPVSAKRGFLPSISAPLRPDVSFITLSTFVMPTSDSDAGDVQLTPGVLENPTPMSHSALRELMMSPKSSPRQLGDVARDVISIRTAIDGMSPTPPAGSPCSGGRPTAPCRPTNPIPRAGVRCAAPPARSGDEMATVSPLLARRLFERRKAKTVSDGEEMREAKRWPWMEEPRPVIGADQGAKVEESRSVATAKLCTKTTRTASTAAGFTTTSITVE